MFSSSSFDIATTKEYLLTSLKEVELNISKLGKLEQFISIQQVKVMEKEKLLISRENFLNSFYEHTVKNSNVFELNVGGKIFTTTSNTLLKYPDTLFCVLLSGRWNNNNTINNNDKNNNDFFCFLTSDKCGRLFIDRSGELFHYVLHFLRTGMIPFDANLDFENNNNASESKNSAINSNCNYLLWLRINLIIEFDYYGLLKYTGLQLFQIKCDHCNISDSNSYHIYLFGGHTGKKYSSKISVFHPCNNSITQFNEFPYNTSNSLSNNKKDNSGKCRFGCATIVLHNDIYVFIVGGEDRLNNTSNTVLVYDISNNSIVFFIPLPYYVRFCMCFGVGTSLYVIGGENENDSPIDTAVKINTDTSSNNFGIYVSLSPMLSPRNCASGIVYKNAFIYVFGGFTSSLVLNSIEVYNIEKNYWKNLDSHMNMARFGHSCVLFGDLVYCIGGRNGYGNYLDSVEIFDIVHNNFLFHIKVMLSIPRAWPSTCLVGYRYIYVFGGFNATFEEIQTAEFFDITTNCNDFGWFAFKKIDSFCYSIDGGYSIAF